MTKVIVCAERVREKLITDMRMLQLDSLRESAEEKLRALESLYMKHMYVVGKFSASKNAFGGDELFFEGSICDVAYSIRLL